MKVPKMYKSSDRYNAGVDVIYDDDSKLQFAPFVYAGTESGDNGGDDGEEGDVGMVVTITNNESEGYYETDKSFDEIKAVIDSGKMVMVKWDETTTYVLELGSSGYMNILQSGVVNTFSSSGNKMVKEVD